MALGLENLTRARNSLTDTLQKSTSLSNSIHQQSLRFTDISKRLPSLEGAVRPIRANEAALSAVGGHVLSAVGPAAAVLKVFDAVHGLEKSLLSDPREDLPGYLSVVRRLEEALRFLGENCAVAVQWLGDIVEYLEDNRVADGRFLERLRTGLRDVADGNGDAEGRVDGGLLDASLGKLEAEFGRLLRENSVVLAMESGTETEAGIGTACIAASPVPVAVVQKLQAIIGRLVANNRLENCVCLYVEVRSENVKASLRALDLDYLELSVSEFNSLHSIEVYVLQWGKHLEFAVKHLFEAEYRLCNDVFERFGVDVWMDCFAKIAARSGILAFLKFGMTVTESKNDIVKLMKLLDIFASLNKLRLDFNRLFGGAACIEIQKLTRDLIKRVIDGASEIFWNLSVQVEYQRQIPPPPDGGVPVVESVVPDYCNKLLGNDYKPILTQVLAIHRSWKHEKFQEKLLVNEVLNIIKALEIILETWVKAYGDPVLSSFFAMNTHSHLFKNLKGTKLGELLGEPWLRDHDQYKDYYATIFFRESWAKLPSHLSREGLIMFSGGRATARDLVKKRLKKFNEAFDDLYQRQSNWVVPDRELRERTCQSIVQSTVPVYRSYMQSYGPLVEQDESSSKYAKYTAQTLEKLINSLFQPKTGRYGSFKGRQLSGKLNNGLADLRRTTSAVV